MTHKNDLIMAQILMLLILITVISTGCKPESATTNQERLPAIEDEIDDDLVIDEPIQSEKCDMTQDHNSPYQKMNEDCCHKLAEFDWQTSTYTLKFATRWGHETYDALNYRITCAPGYNSCTDNYGATIDRSGYILDYKIWDNEKQTYSSVAGEIGRCTYETDHFGNFLSVKWNNVELKQ